MEDLNWHLLRKNYTQQTAYAMVGACIWQLNVSQHCNSQQERIEWWTCRQYCSSMQFSFTLDERKHFRCPFWNHSKTQTSLVIITERWKFGVCSPSASMKGHLGIVANVRGHSFEWQYFMWELLGLLRHTFLQQTLQSCFVYIVLLPKAVEQLHMLDLKHLCFLFNLLQHFR